MNIDKNLIKELVKQGKSQKEIAAYLNISVSTLSTKLSELQIKIKDIKTEVNTELVLKLKEEGLTNTQIYQKTGFSMSTIKRYLDNPTCKINRPQTNLIQENVKKLVKAGKTNLEIADILNISPTTARKYTNILGMETNSSRMKSLNYDALNLNENQLDLIYGSLLGDLSIEINCKNARLVIHHGGDQEEYFDHKCKVLSNILSNNIHKEPRYDKRLKKYLPCYHAKTLTHPLFTKIYNILYINNVKTVTKEWLSYVTPRGLAYWFMDDGTSSGSLYTMSFSLEENELLQEWLLNTYNIKTSIHKYKGYNKESDKKLIHGTLDFYYSLFILKESREIFKNLIKPYVVPSMEYKLQMS